MPGSPELLEFYLVEATEYIDALDQLVGSGEDPPDGNALLATARALRGSSTMAKVQPVAALSEALEEIAQLLRLSDTPWSEAMGRSLAGCVTDLRLLVRGVRVWSDREQQRADARLADLQRFLGDRPEPLPAPPPEATTPVFIALQGAAIAAELDAFTQSPGARRSLDDAVGRMRTLRGIAGIVDYPPLADVADAVDRVARQLMPDAPLADTESGVFRAAAQLFRRVSEQLRTGSPFVAPSAESEAFAAAVAALDAPARSTPPVVRIEQLFYGDQGPHVIERAPLPPVDPRERLHRELVARADHLRRLVTEGRQAADPIVGARIRREIRATTREVETLAASFGAHQLAAFFAESQDVAEPLAPSELQVLGAAAEAIGQPFPSIEELERRVNAIVRPTPVSNVEVRNTPAAPPSVQRTTPMSAPAIRPTPAPAVRVPSPVPPPPPGASAPTPSSSRVASATPTGRDLKELLRNGIESFRSLDQEPLIAPADVDGDTIVPIEELLYQGPSALARAIELRDAWRARGTPEADDLREIFDLLDLAGQGQA